MRLVLIIAAFGLVASQTMAATPQVSPSERVGAAQSQACERLSADYEDVSKSLAQISAEGLLDDSAPRETVRQIQINTEWQKVSIIASYMRDSKCTLPSRLPDSIRYMSAAVDCEKAKVAAQQGMYPPSPDSENKQKAMMATCSYVNWHPELPSSDDPKTAVVN